jgi:hypothetical protein
VWRGVVAAGKRARGHDQEHESDHETDEAQDHAEEHPGRQDRR